MKGLIVTLLFTLSVFAAESEMNIYLQTLHREVLKEESAFRGFDSKRGEQIFTSKHIGKKGKEISCTSCHGNNLSIRGENFFTGKVIEPLAPSANAERLRSTKNVKKWLRRNFMDVYNREGTAKEKGDVISYILSK